MDIEKLLASHEGKTLEYKRDLSSPENVIKTIIAFANSAGGTIVIGVADRTKKVIGVGDALAVEERLASIMSDSICPMLCPEMEIISWRGADLLLIRVHLSSCRPHFVKRLGVEKGVYIRVGSTNRSADKGMRDELARSVRFTTFDEEPLPRVDSEAIDFRVASELFEPVRKLRPKDLETLKIITNYHGRIVPTVGGILLFGKNREDIFPDAWIQCGRFKGNSRAKIIDHIEIHDYPAKTIETAISFIQKHSYRSISINQARHTESWSIPFTAIRECIINAVVHADYNQRGSPIRISLYDDRLEIENPGLLPIGLTIQDIIEGISKLRNRVFGRVFKELKLIEQWGSGIHRILESCSASGLGMPVFEEIGNHFRVTIPTEKMRKPDYDSVNARILELIRNNGTLSTHELSRRLKVSTRTMRTRLRALADQHVIVAIGKNERDPKRRYAILHDAE